MQTVNLGPNSVLVTCTCNGTFVDVTNETQLVAALQAGKNVMLKNDFSFLAPVVIVEDDTIVTSDCNALLTFTGRSSSGVVAGILVAADDVKLCDFRLTSAMDMGWSDLLYGICFPNDCLKGHRAKIQRLEVYNWNRCMSKDGGFSANTLDDVLVEDCYFHTFKYTGLFLSFGMRRLTVQRFRSLGKVGSDTHTVTGNGVICAANLYDLHFADCEVGNVGRMGMELIVADYDEPGPATSVHVRTRLERIYCHDTGGYGISLGHCKDGIVRDCYVKNFRGIGIEYSGRLSDLGYGQIINPTIDGMQGGGAGVSIDKVTKVHLIGGIIRNNTDPQAMGVQLQDTTYCSVRDVEFIDTGWAHIHVMVALLATSAPANSATGNRFHQDVPPAGTPDGQQYAILAHDQAFIARNNTAYVKGTAKLYFNSTGVMGVWSEQTGPITAGDFSSTGTQPGSQASSSNLRLMLP